jgi:uncharacterized protein YbcC (UPF0753/DUF2309 family)
MSLNSSSTPGSPGKEAGNTTTQSINWIRVSENIVDVKQESQMLRMVFCIDTRSELIRRHVEKQGR